MELLNTRDGDYDMACAFDYGFWGVTDGVRRFLALIASHLLTQSSVGHARPPRRYALRHLAAHHGTPRCRSHGS